MSAPGHTSAKGATAASPLREVLRARRAEIREALEINEEAALACQGQDSPARSGVGQLLAVLIRREADELAQIDAALERLERGTFGICARCSTRIDARRLAMAPETPLCGACDEEEAARMG